MYPQFHSVQELSKNHDIWFQVLFGSLWIGYGSVLVPAHFFTFAFGLFSSWQNLGFGSVCSCWVRFLYHFLFAYLNIIQCQQLWDVVSEKFMVHLAMICVACISTRQLSMQHSPCNYHR